MTTRPMGAATIAWVACASALGVTACRRDTVKAGPPAPVATHPAWPGDPRGHASNAFRALWYDGSAELSGYRATQPRYGELRAGELVLVYVTEPMDRRTWIKDDDVAPAERVDVLKLNASLRFLAGIYPYSVMTSVFAPIDDWSDERFSPAKITITAQEWCGHVFQALWPGRDEVESQVASYFASEGEHTATVPVVAGTLYEDALLIQLRELDGPFAGGGDWSGMLVPSLWRVRRSHEAPRPVPARITRSSDGDGNGAVTRFVLAAGDYRRTFDIGQAAPHRVLGWTTSDGEDVRLLGTARLPYWELNRSGDETYRAQLGLAVETPRAPPAAPAGMTSVGR
ncbi:MAG: hypothetical protein HY908_05760 [Myxococcales bacterium]|nr:hypothetical protein [Myxococcales bacterium]